ncbi:uncharacterized protein BDZ83DRAFT_613939 [Colletotrichum acutatum]|uniref:AAA+ ATPase domain-containing protein n=1 Tax=Glomerella acutata TaxID=27357 RepID=A0AAD8UNC3_GLOAC|nr:uncharacterized protein BDZ83DRAFT_613939 [Colletotrichum acutatum]KAK1727011.1 hypothetical protein BDZ83DRAFT_613939 [Colletotrichum acutatum]
MAPLPAGVIELKLSRVPNRRRPDQHQSNAALSTGHLANTTYTQSAPESDGSGSEDIYDRKGRSQKTEQDLTTLFRSSTISRDDTQSQAEQEREKLSHLKFHLNSDNLQLSNSKDAQFLPSQYIQRSFSNTSRALPRPSLPDLAPPHVWTLSQSVQPDFPARASMPPPPPPPPLPPLPAPSPRPFPMPYYAPSQRIKRHRLAPVLGPPRFPLTKASKNSKWRRKLHAQRQPSSEERREDIGVRNIEQLNVNSNLHDGEKSKTVDLPTIKEQHDSGHNVNLAESLALITERYLGVDVLDQGKEVSAFVSYLLDTIEILQSQAKFRAAYSYDSDSESESVNLEVAVSQPPDFQTVHQLFCTVGDHHHGGMLSQDEPVARRTKFAGDTGWLEAKRGINNLEIWLGERPSLCFIVIREHRCSPDQKTDDQRHRTQKPSLYPSARRERLRIVSPILQRALNKVAEFQVHPENRHYEAAMEMDAPYLFLFHHRRRLATLADTETYQEVLLPLMNFLKESYEAEYTEAEEMFAQGHVNAHHIHKLFKPNQMLLKKEKGDPSLAFVLKDYSRTARNDIMLEGWKWEYDGNDLERTNEFGVIRSISEEKTNICDLSIHPIEFAREEDIKLLTQRGNKFWSMRDQAYTCYTGWDSGSKHQYASARFMVDTATYHMMHVESPPSPSERSRQYDPWPMKVNRREDLPHNAEMLMPATVHGFNLQQKKWVNLNVENTHQVDWNHKAFQRLVLDEKIKEMIHALVNVQTSTKKMDDIITGKGNGLIILLHGSPGTGKTLTAESVAEIAEKPLYRVTCGDIGTEAPDVEKYLETVMYLGKAWDCVLLLDEADVFLEERTMADLQRNSLVSVFLRLLEYYEGILILTSNRVGSFDEAFKSRIQVAIHYDNLTKMSRKAIWQNFFDMIEESTDEDANMPELERRLDQLASEEMNGRQIRNVLLTARQLAKHRKERLDWEHLSQVIKTSAAFNKYLRAVRGHTDEQWARGESLR